MSSNDKKDVEVDPDLYIQDFSDFIRDLMRGLAANDRSSSLASASRRLRNLFTHADKLPPHLNWYKIIDSALEKLDPPSNDRNNYDDDYNDLALKSVKYLAELTTADGLSQARTSKARSEIQDEIRAIEVLRETRKAEFYKRH